MKTFNKITSLFVLFLLLGFMACTEKVKYDPAEALTNAQVYFSKDEPTSISLLENQSSFLVNVYRQNTQGDLTVNLTGTDENNLFNVPSSVSFKSGDDKASFNVTFDFSKIEANTDYSLNIKLDSETTEYAPSELSLLIRYAPWTDWQLFGTGTYIYDGYFTGDDQGLELYFQQSLLNPNLYNFRLEHWLYDVNLFFSYDISTGNCTLTTPIFTGYTNATYGKLYVVDVVTYANVIRGGTSTLGTPSYADYPCTFNEETGVFSLSLMYYVDAGNWGTCVETFKLDGYATYDYSMTLKYLGHYIDVNKVDNAVVQFTKGSDAASYKYVLVDGALTSSSAESVANEIIAETIATEEDTESGFKVFPLTDAGKYSVVAVSFDENGDAQDFGYTTFEFTPAGMTDPWVSLGYCKYTDDLFVPLYSDDVADIPTYDVEILQNKDNPGLFRLKNAYGAGYPYNEPGDYDENDVFIEIDATDPDGVFINEQSMGVDWGDGTAYIYSYASYYMDNGKTLDQVKQAGYCGTYKNNIITFPTKTLLVTFEGSTSLYYGNMNGMWKVDMTSLHASPPAKSASLRSGLLRSYNPKKSPLSLKSIQPVRVKGKNVPATVIRDKMINTH